MRGLVVACGLIAAAAILGPAYAFLLRAPPEQDQEREFRPISRAVFAEDRLWLLDDSGALVALAPDAKGAERIAAGGKIVEICKSDDHLLALVGAGDTQWSFQSRVRGNWVARGAVPNEGDTFAAMDCTPDDGRVTVVTNRRLLDTGKDGIRSVKLKQELEPLFGIGTALAMPDAVWLGQNLGEWGGGLRRITRADGHIDVVDSNKSGDLCGGPLNTECDPVNGIAPAPWDASCIVAAVGLVHMMSHGRIVTVCNGRIQRLYFKPFESQPPYGSLDDGEPSSTVAFFGLVRTADAIWAVGIDGLYRFDGARQPRFQPLPKFEERDGYSVSFDVPGIVLVLTDVNQRRSLSGAVPLLVPR